MWPGASGTEHSLFHRTHHPQQFISTAFGNTFVLTDQNGTVRATGQATGTMSTFRGGCLADADGQPWYNMPCDCSSATNPSANTSYVSCRIDPTNVVCTGIYLYSFKGDA
eukprot:TRINITY_DN4119_c0_g1_i1.p3 TRINITY_DN4119_c0_g1~~TRINITY_DN4119_c0_g1_i1.p3  ORF type:complete len:110 (+),score=19.03 TRINITY_DN4119_c0_g1_i1:330-659(+)